MINWIVTSSILIVVVIALRGLLKGRISLRLQYALWGLVLLRLLIPVNVGSSILSLVNTLEKTSLVQDVESVRDVEKIERKVNGVVVGYRQQPETAGSAGEASVAVPKGKMTETEFARMERTLTFRQIAVPMWIGGMVLLAVVFTVSNLQFAIRLRRTRKFLPVENSYLPVYFTDEIETPCLFGLFRPAIYVTEEVAENATMLRHTVAHETTHERHRDHVWAVLRGVCLALHWYNPLVWYGAVLSRNDAELACDEATIKRLGEEERCSYGCTLIGMTSQNSKGMLVMATTMVGSGRNIKERIALIVRKPKTAVYTFLAVMVIAVVALGVTFTGARAADKIENDEHKDASVAETEIKPEPEPDLQVLQKKLEESTATTAYQFLADNLNYSLPEGMTVGAFELEPPLGGPCYPIFNENGDIIGEIEVYIRNIGFFEDGRLQKVDSIANHSFFEFFATVDSKVPCVITLYSYDRFVYDATGKGHYDGDWYKWYAFWAQEDRYPTYAVCLYEEAGYGAKDLMKIVEAVSFSEDAFVTEEQLKVINEFFDKMWRRGTND